MTFAHSANSAYLFGKCRYRALAEDLLGLTAQIDLGVTREGLLPVGFYLFDQFIRALAMLFLNKGTSPTTTLITIPTANRP